MSKTLLKQLTYSGIRLFIFLYFAILVANYLNGRNFSDYISKTMIKIHAEAKIGVDANALSKLFIEKNYGKLQELLDRNAAVYALFITDCTSAGQDCPSQKILFMTNPRLVRPPVIKKLDLKKEGYFLVIRIGGLIGVFPGRISGIVHFL